MIELEEYLARCRKCAAAMLALLPASQHARIEQAWAENFYATKRARQMVPQIPAVNSDPFRRAA